MKKWILLIAAGLVVLFLSCSPQEEKAALTEETPESGRDIRIFPKDTPLQDGLTLEELERAVSVSSRNKNYSAVVYPPRKLTVVYEVKWQGNIGRRRSLWTAENASSAVWLSDDGKHLIAGDEGRGVLLSEVRGDRVMIVFVEQGKRIRQVELDELVADLSQIQQNGTSFLWGSYLGLNAAGYFVIETVEGRKIMYSVRTGTPVEWKVKRIDHRPRWKPYQEIMRCYEFLYPEDFRLHEALDKSGRPTGLLHLEKEETGRLIEIEEENMSVLPGRIFSPDEMSFQMFSVERAKLRFSADGPEGCQWAEGVERIELFTNRNGLAAAEFFLRIIDERYMGDEREPERTRWIEGPLYAVLISQPGEPYRVLLFSLIGEGKEMTQAKEAIRDIVDSVIILK